MKRLIILVGIMLALVVPATADELPPEMVGYWMPMYDGRPNDPNDFPGVMRRIPEPRYEWEVSRDGWLEWDGICKIHDVKQLGEMEYEVGATCGVIDGSSSKPYKMSHEDNISEGRYQFSLCGEILHVRALKDRKAEPEGCKIS
jgi:hypothetical protein